MITAAVHKFYIHSIQDYPLKKLSTAMCSVIHMASDINNRMNQAGRRDERRRSSESVSGSGTAVTSGNKSFLHLHWQTWYIWYCALCLLRIKSYCLLLSLFETSKMTLTYCWSYKRLETYWDFSFDLKKAGSAIFRSTNICIRSVRFLSDQASSLSICHHHFLSQGRGERAYDIYSRLLRERIVCVMGPVSMTNDYMAVRRIHVTKSFLITFVLSSLHLCI